MEGGGDGLAERVQQLENEKHALLDYIQDVNEESALERSNMVGLSQAQQQAQQQVQEAEQQVKELKTQLSANEKLLDEQRGTLVTKDLRSEQLELQLASAQQQVESERTHSNLKDKQITELQQERSGEASWERAELTEAAQMNSDLLQAVR